MDSPAYQSTNSSATVLASAATNHSALAPSNFIGYFLKVTKPGDIRILWERVNLLGEIEERCFDAHQDVICRQSKVIAAIVRSKHQEQAKQQRLLQWKRKDYVSLSNGTF
jgi:predicted DNA-binding WGR domain protein